MTAPRRASRIKELEAELKDANARTYTAETACNEWIDVAVRIYNHRKKAEAERDAALGAVATAKAEGRAERLRVMALIADVERLNAACDAMWNDLDRVESRSNWQDGDYAIKEAHCKAITEAQQRLPATLAQLKESTNDGD